MLGPDSSHQYYQRDIYQTVRRVRFFSYDFGQKINYSFPAFVGHSLLSWLLAFKGLVNNNCNTARHVYAKFVEDRNRYEGFKCIINFEIIVLSERFLYVLLSSFYKYYKIVIKYSLKTLIQEYE